MYHNLLKECGWIHFLFVKKIMIFTENIIGFRERIFIRGLGGFFPLCELIFTDIPQEMICENSVCGRPQAVLAILLCVMTQAVLAIPVLEYKRVLACMGRLLKTHTGVTAHTDKKF